MVLHGRAINQQIDNRGTSALFQARQTLADNTHDVQRQIHQYLLVAVFRIEVHNPLDGLHRIVRVDGEYTQVTRLCQLQRIFHGVFVTYLANTDHIRRLTHGRLHRHRPRSRVHAQFALRENRFNRFVQIFHRVLNGYNVAGRMFIAPVQHRRHGSGFTRTGRTRQNQQAARFHGQLFQTLRQFQIVHRQNIGGDAAPNHAHAALLVVRVHTETDAVFGRGRIVQFQFMVEARTLLGRHGGIHQHLRVLLGQGFQWHGGQFAVDFE